MELQKLQPFHGKGPQVLLWADSLTVREKITGLPNSLNYCVIFTVYKREGSREE